MNKAELTQAVALKTKLSKAKAAEALNAAFDTIQASLKKGKNVALIGFGTFKVRSRKARTGRNPQTGAALKIKACKVPAFSAGKALKKAVN